MNDVDMASPEDPPTTVSDEQRTLQPIPRKSLLDMLGGNADQGHNQKIAITTQTQEPGVPESVITSPPSTSPTKPFFPRPESRMSSIARQLPGAADIPRADPSSFGASVPPEFHAHDPQDSDVADPYADDPDSPSPDPFSLFSDLSEVVRESADLDRITTLHRALIAEREELLRRHEETTRALSRTKSQLDHVLSLTDEAFQMTATFVGKEKARLENKKTKAEAKIEHRKNLEAEQRRKAKELERIRQQEEERKAQIEMEQQAERQRLEEQRREEEALAAERLRLEEIQAKERAKAEEHRRIEEERTRIEEEERRRLAEEDQRRRDDEERKRQAEEEEEERLRRQIAERETMARKQEEDRRTQLLERRRLAEEDRRRKEANAAAAKAEAEKQAAEKEQQRIFLERRATVLKDKYKNYNRPELGPPFTGSTSTFEGTHSSNLPVIFVDDVQKNPQAVEHHSGLAKINRVRDTPTFVPAATEAGKLLPDLSRPVVSNNNAVKHETTSPVITPVDNTEPTASNPSTPLPSRPLSSMSTAAPALAPGTLAAAPHLPSKPVTIYSKPPKPRYPSRRSRSRSRSSSRSPRRRSPVSRLPSRTSRSPEPPRGRPPAMRNMNMDHYSPPHQGSRYDSRSLSPPPPNPRKRSFQDHWDRADTPSKLDYSHPAKRRIASPLRSRSPPSPRPRPLTQPPHVVSIRRPPPTGRRGRGAPLPLEQRLSSRPQNLSERIK